ncbi:MAG: hypothetical protein K9M57_01820 [Phycisphaerae bacterium]|nr:hypothetical protein [Phycisphaerae bacterium]
MAEPYFLIRKQVNAKKPSDNCGYLEDTSAFLAGLAFKYGATGDLKSQGLALKVVTSLQDLDWSNGLDGYIPFSANIKNSRLHIAQNETHVNAYSQLFFSYFTAMTLFDDPALKNVIRKHMNLITNYFLKHNLVLKDNFGNKVPFSDITSSAFKLSAGRCLDGLVFVDFSLWILENQKDSEAYTKLTEIKKEMVSDGYYRKIANLHFKFFTFELPSDSTDWLNFIRLYILNQIENNDHYKNALKKLFASQRNEYNPLFNSIYASVFCDKTDEVKEKTLFYLNSFPLTLDNAEVINSQNPDVKKKFFLQLTKNKLIPESKLPLEIYKRPFRGLEWKRNPCRLDGNLGKDGNIIYPGTDFYLAYWMGRYYGLMTDLD